MGFYHLGLFLSITFSCFFSEAQFQEYQHFTDFERQELNAPRLVGSEYESDRLTYEFLSAWNSIWISDENIFQYTAGSLGPTRFLTRGRFRFRNKMGSWLDFQLSYSEQGDAKQDQRSMVFEFIAKPWKTLNFALYGQPSTLKKQDDVGLAALINFHRTSVLRVYYTAVDFSHNKRNEETDTYLKQPWSSGFIWRQWDPPSAEVLSFSYRHDASLVQEFSNTRTYSFGADTARFVARKALTNSLLSFLQTEINYIQRHEGDTENTDGGVERWNNTSFDALLQYEHKLHWFHIVGIRAVYSIWESSQGNVIHNNILPHTWFTVYRNENGGVNQWIDLGYEFTWHRGQGDSVLRSDLDRNDKLEHRLNARYRLLSGPHNTHLNFLLTFDLDRFGSGETWEGGAMQFSTNF